ncbi:hypothetical protein PGT21_019642 [Puccinia graminis f. sp. tritici]|uniref:Uncharacterized protein n=1 Tax=Puccinia graminis f. sp. tritici TaxID=56615 RepID=A0A5B0NJR5_PUCGR|nr:hypothetical protein PGT21_019642 [Puccinia graminis f. sp. tritici]
MIGSPLSSEPENSTKREAHLPDTSQRRGDADERTRTSGNADAVAKGQKRKSQLENTFEGHSSNVDTDQGSSDKRLRKSESAQAAARGHKRKSQLEKSFEGHSSNGDVDLAESREKRPRTNENADAPSSFEGHPPTTDPLQSGSPPPITSEARTDLLTRVMKPLAHCWMDHSEIDLRKRDARKFEELAEQLEDLLVIIIDAPRSPSLDRSSMDIEGDLLRLSLEPLKPSPKNFDHLAGQLFAKMSEMWDVLTDPQSLRPAKLPLATREGEVAVPSHYAMMYRLNDIWVEFLAVSAKHNLLSDGCLEGYLNNKNAAHGVYNYIMGKFVPWQSIASLYLNLDLKLGLEESRFARGARSLWKHVSPSTWQTLTRLYLVAQFRSFAYGATYQTEELLRLINPFVIVTSDEVRYSDKSTHDTCVMSFVALLLDHIFETPNLRGHGPDSHFEIRRHGVLIKMLRYMMQFHIKGVSNELMAELQKMDVYPQIQAYDEAALLFSDVLDSMYVKYGEVLQNLSPHELVNRRRKLDLWDIIHLTNRSQRNQPSIFSLGANEELPLHYNQGVSAESSIGIEKPNYRFKHLLHRDFHSFPEWRKRMEKLGSEFSHPTPPSISILEQESREIAKTLQTRLDKLSPKQQANHLDRILQYSFHTSYSVDNTF